MTTDSKALIERIAVESFRLSSRMDDDELPIYPQETMTIRAIESLCGRIVFPDMVTEEMENAVCMHVGHYIYERSEVRNIFKDMIAAAPKLGGE